MKDVVNLVKKCDKSMSTSDYVRVHYSARLYFSTKVVKLVDTFLLLPPECEVLLEELYQALCLAKLFLFKLINLVEGCLDGTICNLNRTSRVADIFVPQDGEI